MASDQEPTYPTREEVWNDRSAARTFPTPLVEGARTAVSFFCAAFFGRNDVVFLDHLGIPDVVLVDLNHEHLDVMAKIYPGITETHAEDAYAVAKRMASQPRRFDVVTCDPFTNESWRVFADHFDTFSVLARRSWVTGVMVGDLEQVGIPATLGGVQSWLDAHGRRGWEATWLEVRNSATGLSWLGLQRRRTGLGRILARLGI